MTGNSWIAPAAAGKGDGAFNVTQRMSNDEFVQRECLGATLFVRREFFASRGTTEFDAFRRNGTLNVRILLHFGMNGS
jgi:hypothetical protein